MSFIDKTTNKGISYIALTEYFPAYIEKTSSNEDEYTPPIEMVPENLLIAGITYTFATEDGYISANKDLVTVFSLGSEGPDVGVMSAIESQGKSGEILHYGFDYTDTWLKGIEDGRITAIVDQDAYQIGYQVIENLVKAIDGEEIDKTIPIDVKYVKAADLKAYGEEKSKIKTGSTDDAETKDSETKDSE